MPARSVSAKLLRLESSHERAFVRALRAFNLETLKLNVQGQRGWPDRVVLVPPGKAVFVELKREDKELRALQEYRRERLERAGFIVLQASGEHGVLHAVQMIKRIAEWNQ